MMQVLTYQLFVREQVGQPIIKNKYYELITNKTKKILKIVKMNMLKTECFFLKYIHTKCTNSPV